MESGADASRILKEPEFGGDQTGEPAGKRPRKLGKGEQGNEKDLSAESQASLKATWISQEDVAPSGQGYHQCSASQRKKATLSLTAVSRISSLRLRSDFERLRGQGTTVRSGNVHIRYAKPESSSREQRAKADDDLRIAYAIGKKAGKAVKRNRLRRQLRGVFREINASSTELLPAGDYLVRIATLESSYSQLKEDVKRALKQLAARTAENHIDVVL